MRNLWEQLQPSTRSVISEGRVEPVGAADDDVTGLDDSLAQEAGDYFMFGMEELNDFTDPQGKNYCSTVDTRLLQA